MLPQFPMLQPCLYNQYCENCSKSMYQTQFSLYLNRFLGVFFGFYLILCGKIRATIWANFCAIWSTGSKVIALLVIFNSLFSLYLNHFCDGFFGFYLILCRKIRATIWARNLTIWSTGSRDIAFLVILCSFLLLFSFSSSNYITITFNKV